MSEETPKSIDKATLELIEKAKKEEISTAFFRAEEINPAL